MLTWLKIQSWCVFTSETCAGAAAAGQLSALQHLRREGCGWYAESIARHAASSGSIEVVEWLRQQQGIQINARTLAGAASAGQTAMCQHLRSLGCEWDVAACGLAAEGGHLDTLRWLREHGCAWDLSEIVTEAACYGHTDTLNFVIKQGEVLSAELLTEGLNYAGILYRMETAQWFRERGAEWPAVLGEGAEPFIEEWQDEMLAWARAGGCTSPTRP
jgi:hypothetical protein